MVILINNFTNKFTSSTYVYNTLYFKHYDKNLKNVIIAI